MLPTPDICISKSQVPSDLEPSGPNLPGFQVNDRFPVVAMPRPYVKVPGQVIATQRLSSLAENRPTHGQPATCGQPWQWTLPGFAPPVPSAWWHRRQCARPVPAAPHLQPSRALKTAHVRRNVGTAYRTRRGVEGVGFHRFDQFEMSEIRAWHPLYRLDLPMPYTTTPSAGVRQCPLDEREYASCHTAMPFAFLTDGFVPLLAHTAGSSRDRSLAIAECRR